MSLDAVLEVAGNYYQSWSVIECGYQSVSHFKLGDDLVIISQSLYHCDFQFSVIADID